MKEKKDKTLNLILPIVTVLAILVFWAIASAIIGNGYVLPSLKQTTTEFFSLLKSSEFYLAFFMTLLRSIIAFVLSFVFAFILSVFALKCMVVNSIADTVTSIMRALPTIAVVLLLLFWTNSFISSIIVTVLVVLPTVYTGLKSAFSSQDKTVAEAGRVDGADEKQVFLLVQLPQALPSVYRIVGSGISLNFKLMVAAEVIAQTARSIGYLLNTAKVYFEVARMFALVCATVIIGVIIEFIFNKISDKVGEWR